VIILPGVGAFDTAIASMQKSGLISAVKEAAADPDKTIIGICLGMQLLFERSEEGESEGLALLEGQVKRIPDQSVVLPHVGWNPLVSKCADDLLAIDSKEVYFTHSYYVECDDKYIEYYVDYEVEVPAVIRHGNLIGFQFHPEKSSSVGRELLKSVIVA
jgi:glutamine amidotransferase